MKTIEADSTGGVRVQATLADANEALQDLEADFRRFMDERKAERERSLEIERRLATRLRHLKERLGNAGEGEARVARQSMPGPAAISFDPVEAGRQAVEALKAAEGGAWTGVELAERFGLTSATLHRRRKEHRIVYWRNARHEFHYPKWQFTEAGALVPGVQEALQTLDSDDEWRVMSYFLGQRQQLGNQRPLDLLRAGEKEAVLAHAKLHAQENTW